METGVAFLNLTQTLCVFTVGIAVSSGLAEDAIDSYMKSFNLQKSSVKHLSLGFGANRAAIISAGEPFGPFTGFKQILHRF